MRINRQGLVSSASRRARRAKKTTGRVLFLALGFGVAYYLDTENGELRRKRLRERLQRLTHNIDSVFAPEAGDPPPVFFPVLRGHGSTERGAKHA